MCVGPKISCDTTLNRRKLRSMSSIRPSIRARTPRCISVPKPWPWEARTPVDTLVAAGFPILVVSGGQRPMYEEIGDGLAAALRAERRIVPAGHAVQAAGAPFNAVLEEFLVRAEAAAVASGRAGAGGRERLRTGTAA
jgi:hypothetical protein